MKVRIGIDVGGTFTDAVAINHDTFELIGKLKIPTTHESEEGVASGIIQAVKGILDEYKIKPEDVFFIAHGTTQATNALLEGDVVKVGILAAAQGIEGAKVKSDTNIGTIELAPKRYLYTENAFVDTSKTADFLAGIKELLSKGAKVIVASSPFAVDNPDVEEKIRSQVNSLGIPCTVTNEISKLYGLRVRTRTAVINASILPKMMETANMTESSIIKAGIKAPLMIMRCDGGVMSINEVRTRPILTMLSGPAAGVAGALMYERVSNGLFLEVGGTSTDISVIKDGRVMIEYAEVGGHKTYLNSLDVRTVGIAGGSMIRINDKGVEDSGPRSAHIAGLEYAAYASADDIVDPQIYTFSPKSNDPGDYCAIECSNGKRYAITVSCAANLLGYVSEDSYAYGNPEAIRKAFEPFAKKFNITAEAFARQIMDKASEKNKTVIQQMMKDYDLSKDQVVLIGGGGGCAAIVPYLADYMKLKFKIAKNAEVISPIGVALAMVRDVVERSILNPTDEDILAIRKEAEQSVIHAGANPETVEVHVEIDTAKNIVRATGTGTTELRAKDLTKEALSPEELIGIARDSVSGDVKNIKIESSNGSLHFVRLEVSEKKMFAFSKKTFPVRVIDDEGVIRLQKGAGVFYKFNTSNLLENVKVAIEKNITADDGGVEIPMVYLFIGKKIIDFSGLVELEHILSMIQVETNNTNYDRIDLLICERGKH